MGRYLNHDLGFDEIRWRISRDFSPDFRPAFKGKPVKRLVAQGTCLARLIWLPTDTIFEGIWWMPKEELDRLRNENNRSEHGSGRQLRNSIAQAMALPKANYQLSITEIELLNPVYAWTGQTAPLFKRPGGSEQ